MNYLRLIILVIITIPFNSCKNLDNVSKKADENFKNNHLNNISKNKNDSLFKKWCGTYSLNFHKERKHSTTMYWQHVFIVENEHCTYEGSGFQFYSKYNCVTKFEDNKLLIFAKENIEGYEIYKKDELIVEIEKINNLYFTKTIDLKPEEAVDNTTRYGFEVTKRIQ